MSAAASPPAGAGSARAPEPFPPPWAGGWGEDAHGLFALLTFGTTSIELRWVPPGTFQMGSPGGEPGRTDGEGLHPVRISQGFWLGRHPVTQAEWSAFAGKPNPSSDQRPLHPVERVSWHEAVEFAEHLNDLARAQKVLAPEFAFRLPTEAEWEYACRAGTGSAFNDGSACTQPTGLDPALDRLGWFDKNSGEATHPVGGKAPNAWGLYDMHGNVWEWCLDAVNGLADGPADAVTPDPLGREGAGRVIRGGSAWSLAGNCRSAYRNAGIPGSRFSSLGFRLAAGQVL